MGFGDAAVFEPPEVTTYPYSTEVDFGGAPTMVSSLSGAAGVSASPQEQRHTVCLLPEGLGYFTTALIKHHSQGNFEKEGFTWGSQS